MDFIVKSSSLIQSKTLLQLQCSSKEMILTCTKSVLTEIFNVAKYMNICCENECEGDQRDDDRKGVHR